MARHPSRRLPSVLWQYLRWGLVIPALPLALWACNSHNLQEPLPIPLQETDFSVLVSPERSVDILFMVDNSPSMDPKQAALTANFPLLIQKLQQLQGGLPDVHIGVVSSDMGAGSDNIGGNCSHVLGDKGLLWGNDPNNPIASVAAGNTLYSTASGQRSDYGTPNGCGLALGDRWIVDTANANGVGRTQNYTGQLTEVFTCLAKSVGIAGCGYEHQLQSVAVALNPEAGVNDANVGFIRPKAYLAIVLITDEDDCSADPSDEGNHDHNNNGMFLQRPPMETASMKCAARGHLCNNQPIPGYDPVNGFTPQNPQPSATVGFTANFADCTDKEQIDRTHPDPAYLPLSDVRDMIDYVNGVKSRPQEQILVSGIIGWPPDTTLPGVVTTDQYQIGIDATSLPVPQNTYWDYLPICRRPADQSADHNIYKAYGGLRLKKFVDAFKRGTDVNTFSICNSDFSPAMTQIGNAILKALKPGCVPYPLIDTQPSPPAGQARGPLQPECQVMDEVPCPDTATAGVGTCLSNDYIENSLPECKVPGTGLPLDPSNAQTTSIPDTARPCWYLYYDLTPVTGCPDPEGYQGQRITALRKTGETAPAGTLLAMKCLTCATIDPACPPLHP